VPGNKRSDGVRFLARRFSERTAEPILDRSLKLHATQTFTKKKDAILSYVGRLGKTLHVDFRRLSLAEGDCKVAKQFGRKDDIVIAAC